MKKNIQHTTFKCYSYFLIFILIFLVQHSNAQKDSTKKTSIDITSSYKPVLRSSAKINFAASQLIADTSIPKIKYYVPAQNLFYSYQPISLKPLALQQDTNLYLGLRNYLKLGFGNFSTPYASAGFSFGDGKSSLLNLYANYLSSKGKIKYQDFSALNVKATGSYFLPKNEAYGSIDITQNDTYLYGYNHDMYNYTKDSVKNQFQDITLTAGIRNTIIGNFGIKYNPSIKIDMFNNKEKLNESTLIATAPIEKQFGTSTSVLVTAKADITSYSTKNLLSNAKFSNNIFQIAPALSYSSARFNIHAGIIPTWENGNFAMLPNIFAEGQLKEKVLYIQAGWVGNIIKNNFKNLYLTNPYLQPLLYQLNTKEIEYYGGIKASISSHFNFSAKIGLLSYNNLPLYINDTATDNKTFKIVYEPKANNIRVHGDLSYINQDKFTLTTGLTLNGYTGFNNNTKAWNTIPMEITSSLRWWAFKQVLLKSDLYIFGGGNYLTKNNTANSFKGGTDLSIGAEFKITKMFSAWLDVNNVLNNKYQRWHNYEVLGLNVVGGVKMYF